MFKVGNSNFVRATNFKWELANHVHGAFFPSTFDVIPGGLVGMLDDFYDNDAPTPSEEGRFFFHMNFMAVELEISVHPEN